MQPTGIVTPCAVRSDHTSPLVSCTDVSRVFTIGSSALVAVRAVSCNVGEGASIAIMGPSGSGKSTLLHLMAGLDHPSTGVVSWPAFGDQALRPGPVSVVFQGPSLLPPLDVVENVALPLLLGGASESDAATRAHEALDRLGLGFLASKLPEELSGGQSQRVAVARTLAGRPRLLLADEPTGQLDHEAGAHVVDALIAAADHLGAGLVITTHDPHVAGRLAHRWTMHDGVLDTADMAGAST